MNGKRRVSVALVLVLCGASLVSAADGAGRIEGRVLKDGKGVGGVVVLIAERRASEVTDADGSFSFAAVPAGIYTLVFTLGNNTASRTEVGVTAGQTRRLDVPVEWDLGVYESVTVTAAAARAAKIVDAPAAVTSIPEEQIEREASHGQLPKILEFTPGAEITQSGLYDFNFNTRGFNSSLNRRVSTYIDGRDVGVVLLGAQEWAALSIPLDDLGGLEFIRGPSAALYGANASSGVVNMTTKAPRDSQGSMFRLTGGALYSTYFDFRQAKHLTGDWYYKIVAGARDSDDFSVDRNPALVPRPEYSSYCFRVGEVGCLQREKPFFLDRDKIRFVTARADRYIGDEGLLTIEAGTTNIEGPVFQTGIGRVQVIDADRPFARVNWSNRNWNVLAHYAERNGHQVNLAEDLRVGYDIIDDTARYGVEAQGHWNFGGDRGRFVIGGAHTEERVDSLDPKTGKQTLVWEPLETDRQAVFSQLDWRFNEHVKLVLAGRVDENTLHSTQFSPKFGLVYNLNPANTFRLTYNEAFQVANYSEFFLHVRLTEYNMGTARVICAAAGMTLAECGLPEVAPILAVGNDDLRLEQTRSWEVGYSRIIARRAFVTLDYYNSTNEDFITDLVPQVSTSLGNPINTDYVPWVGSDAAETTELLNTGLTVAQAVRNSIAVTQGPLPFGFALAQDLDGSTVIVGRTYANVGQVDTQGVDLGVQWFINDVWNVQASYSWFDFEIVDAEEDVQEILLPNSPEHKASLSIAFRKGRLDGSLSGRWVDEFFWSAGIFQGPVDAYSTVDLALGLQVGKRATVGVNVANLRDSVHRQTFGGDLLSRRALAHVAYVW